MNTVDSIYERAFNLGYDNRALKIASIAGKASAIADSIKGHVKDNSEAYIGGAVGAAGGAAVGAATGGKGKRVGRAILGSLLGGGAGAGIGHMAKTISDREEQGRAEAKARNDKYDEEFRDLGARISQGKMPRPSRHLGVMRGSDAELQHNYLRDMRRASNFHDAVKPGNDMRRQVDEMMDSRDPYPDRARAASPQ